MEGKSSRMIETGLSNDSPSTKRKFSDKSPEMPVPVEDPAFAVDQSQNVSSNTSEKPIHESSSTQRSSSNDDDTINAVPEVSQEDPYLLRGSKWEEEEKTKKGRSIREVQGRLKKRKVVKYYNRQNALIDAYLGSMDEEAAEVQDTVNNGWKVKFAVNASFSVNGFLFVIQLYAAVSTGSLALFGTAADAFVSLI